MTGDWLAIGAWGFVLVLLGAGAFLVGRLAARLFIDATGTRTER